MRIIQNMKILCPYCGKRAELADSIQVYKTKSYGPIYLCKCVEGWAYVGVNKATGKPLGSLADSSLRMLRKQAHNLFDKLWKDGIMTRSKAYSWLSTELNVKQGDCHIGMFGDELCIKTIKLIEGNGL
ncbi:hypothetical protein JZU46_02855 [bacterium]|nr:hypothetical protein [bacterium]